MTSIPEPPGNGDRHCAAPTCAQPPNFRIRLDHPGEPPGDFTPRSADACATHLVDVIHQLAQWAKSQSPHPAQVTVYVADQTPGTDIPPSPPTGFEFTTLHVPN